MSSTGCEPFTAAITAALEHEAIAQELLSLRAAGHSDVEVLRCLLAHIAPDAKEDALRELGELPRTLASTIIQSWVLARESGRRFRLSSVRPDRPFTFARQYRVRLTTDYDEEIVTVGVSHVPGRHALWYQPGAALDVAAGVTAGAGRAKIMQLGVQATGRGILRGT
jgi:hypothetical protein